MRRPGSPTWSKMAGVSRAAFYEHFKDKQECLLAAVDALVEPTIALMERAEDAPTGEARVRQAVEAFLGLVAEQPAASKMGFIEVYAAGPEGEAAVERVLDTFERFGVSQLNQIPGRKGMPPQMVRAMIGGFQKVIQKRLYSDEADQLPRLAEEIADWGLSYPPPPGPLEGPRRRGRKPRPFAERQAVAHPPERVLRALAATVAEKGYKATTVAEVVERAGTSHRVFYGHFANKEEAFLAALDSGSAQMLAAVLPAFRRAGAGRSRCGPPTRRCSPSGSKSPSTRSSARSRCTRSASGRCRPATRVMEGLEALLVPGYELAPDTPPIAAEAIGGAIYALIHDQVKRRAGKHAGTGADGHLHDAGPVRRRRGGLRAGNRGERQMVSAHLSILRSAAGFAVASRPEHRYRHRAAAAKHPVGDRAAPEADPLEPVRADADPGRLVGARRDEHGPQKGGIGGVSETYFAWVTTAETSKVESAVHALLLTANMLMLCGTPGWVSPSGKLAPL